MKNFDTLIESVNLDFLIKCHKKFINSYKNDFDRLTYLSIFLDCCLRYMEIKDTSDCMIFYMIFEKHHNYCLENLKGRDLNLYLKVSDKLFFTGVIDKMNYKI